MLHLLTETQKNKVIKEYRMRLVVVICILIALVSLTGVALILPSYLIAVGKVNTIKVGNQSKEESIKILNDQNFKDKLKKIDSSLDALKMSINTLSPREAYNKIINSLPEGVVLNRYTYSLVDDSTAAISIDGVAIDRNNLLDLHNKLKLNPEFIGIDIPITSFTKKKDLNFSLKFNLIKVIKK